MPNGKAGAIQRHLRPSLRALHVLGVLLVLHLAARTLGATGRVVLLDPEDATSPLAQRVVDDARKPSDYEHPAKQRLGQVVADLDTYNPFCPGCPDPAVAGTAVMDAVKGPRTGTGTVAQAEQTPVWITWSDGTVLGRRLEPGEPESELPLSLLATMQAEPRELSMATIAHDEGGGIGLFGVGEQIVPGVHLQQVGSGVVHLRNDGVVEYLVLEERHQPPAPAKKKKKKPKKKAKKNPHELPGARDAVKCDGNKACTLDRAFVNKLIANPAQLAKQARLRPLRKDGEMQGYKVYGVRKGSLPHLLKLKNGDLLKSIDGRDLDSMDAAMSLYQQFRNASHLRITIERRGKPLEMHYDIR